MSNMIWIAAIRRPNTVTASAMRVIGLRQLAPVSVSAAETSVPAMLTPIRKMKLTI